jgi:hypothetical protein
VSQSAQASASPDPSAAKRTNIQTAILIVVAIGVIAGLLITMVTRDTPISCPDELIGAWKTAARGYEDGMLVITKTAVVFSAGGEHVDGQAVRRLETFPEGPRTLYTIVYGNSRSEEQILSFYYHTREQTITFKNQSHLVWTRKTVES